MINYAQVNEQNKVVAVAPSSNLMVEINSLDNRLLGTTYSAETGEFTGYKITLSADKPYIMADGADTIKITATVKTWDEKDAPEYSAPIIFLVDGTPKFIAKKADGTYYTTYKTTVPGNKTILTQNTDVISNGQIVIMAVEVE